MRWEIISNTPDKVLADKWKAFLSGASYPTHYTSPNFFIDPFVRGGERFCVLAFDENDHITAVISGIDCGKKIFSGLASRPQIAFRKNVDVAEATAALLAGTKEKGGSDLEFVTLHSWQEIPNAGDLGLRRRHNDANEVVMLDLSLGANEIFKGFSQTRRNEIRKVLKQGLVEIKEIETESELLELYEIHKDWNTRKSNRPDSLEDVRLAVEQRNGRRVFVAKVDGKVIAGSFFRFCEGGVVEYAANNSLPEFQRFRPNDLIVWHAIQWACENGFSKFSMGGAHLFLRRFGGEIVTTYGYTLDLTFLERHARREQLENGVKKVYRALPDTLKQKIRAFGKA